MSKFVDFYLIGELVDSHGNVHYEDLKSLPTADVVPYSIEDGKITIDLSEIIDKIHGCAIKLYFGKSGADMRGENNELHKRL